MHINKVGGLIALAGVSQAFLLPPSVAVADVKAIEVLPVEIFAAPEWRILEVDCPGCPIVGAKGGDMLWKNAHSKLRFNLSIEHDASQPDILTLNGLQILPIDSRASMRGLYADQLVKGPGGAMGYVASPELGYSMTVKPYHDGNQVLNVWAIHLQVIEVANEFIRGIPPINIKVIRSAGGKIMIADGPVVSRPADRFPTTPQGEKCQTMVCKWKSILAGKMDALKKGCGRKKHPEAPNRIPRPHGIKGGRPKPKGFGRPHPHHEQRRHRNAIFHFFKKLFIRLIIPVLVGMGIGITASVVGMIVGHFIVFVWRMLFRRGERGQCCRKAAEQTEEDCEDESKGFLDHQGPPPVYDEALSDEKAEQKE